MTPPLLLDTTGDIFRLILNAPPGNETDARFFTCLADLIPELHNARCKGLIIHGSGRHFSSGANIAELLGTEEESAKFLHEKSLVHSLSDFYFQGNTAPYPTVAAIRGCCLGSGLEIALACDFRIATPNAIFALPEATFGIMPGLGGTVRLPKLVGLAKSIEMVLSGENILAEDALRIGLIDKIVDKNDLLATAELMIRKIEEPL